MILKICLFLLKSCNACLFSGFFFHIFNAIVSGKLWLLIVFTCDGTFVLVVYVHGWCWNSGNYGNWFHLSSLTAPHVWLRLNFHYGDCVAEVNTEKPILLRQKPRQMPTAEVNYEDWDLNLCVYIIQIY